MAVKALDQDKDSHRSYIQVTVAAGTTSDIYILGVNSNPTISVFPVAGGAALVESSVSPLADIRAEFASVNWAPWGKGNVTAGTSDVPLGVINALRCTATGQDVVFEIVG